MNVVGYWFSERIALKVGRAQPLQEAAAPGLHRLVGELAVRAGIPAPRLYLIGSPQPNAFATGRNPDHAAVAVTARSRRDARLSAGLDRGGLETSVRPGAASVGRRPRVRRMRL